MDSRKWSLHFYFLNDCDTNNINTHVLYYDSCIQAEMKTRSTK
jgi:hypothetical protein